MILQKEIESHPVRKYNFIKIKYTLNNNAAKSNNYKLNTDNYIPECKIFKLSINFI